MIWKHHSLPQLGTSNGLNERQRRNDSRATDPGSRRQARHLSKQQDTRVQLNLPNDGAVKKLFRGSHGVREEHSSIIWSRISSYVKRPPKQHPPRKSGKPSLQIYIPDSTTNHVKSQSNMSLTTVPYSSVRSGSSPNLSTTGQWKSIPPKPLNLPKRPLTPLSPRPDKILTKQNSTDLYPKIQNRARPEGQRRPSPLKLQITPSTVAFGACTFCHVGTPGYRGYCRICDNGFGTDSRVSTPGPKADIWRPLPPLPLTSDPTPPSPAKRQTPPSPKLQEVDLEIILQECITPPPPLRINASTPRTPLSQMSTPTIEMRFQIGKSGSTNVEQDLYDGDWAEYYFDKRNFLGRGDVPASVDRFMHRELGLDEYEAAFDSRVELESRCKWI